MCQLTINFVMWVSSQKKITELDKEQSVKQINITISKILLVKT